MQMLALLAIISGLGLGSIYGLLALGFHMTYAVSATVNFAQGSSMMLGAVLYHTCAVTLGWNATASISLALFLCAVWGLAIERFTVRPFVSTGSAAWLMSTLAAGIVLENVVLFTFGKEPRSLLSPLATNPLPVGGLGVYPLQMLIPVVGFLVALALHLVTRRTLRGKAVLAVVQNPDAARLMGINVPGAVAAAYALSTVFAGGAGMLIAPLFTVSSDMGTLFGIKAFAAAILGGITNAWGVMLAGCVYGIIEALVTAFLGSTYTQIVTFTLVIIALASMPHGLFGRAGVQKV
jgi:branched-chain amino acid transport system permease protein